MITILLAGQARVGKTTAATYIANHAKKLDYKPILLPFAEAIKDEATKLGYTKEVDPTAYRNFCQGLGESMRKINPDHWINLFMDKWKKYYLKDQEDSQNINKLWKETVVIVDDCRYLNELNLGRFIGAKTVFISRGKRTLEDQNAAWRKHESEEMANKYEEGHPDYQDIFNYVIKNEGTKEEYHAKINERLSLLLDASPFSFVECDCLGCINMRKDNGTDIEKFFRDFFL